MRAERRRNPAVAAFAALALLCALPVAAQTIAVRGASSNVSSTAANTVTIATARPTGTVAGDLMVAAIAWRTCRPNTSTGSCTRSLTAVPAGWTQIGSTIDQLNGGGTGGYGMRLALYYRAAGGAEPASYNWTVGGSTHASSGVVAGVVSFTNVDTANPVVTQAGDDTNSGTRHTAPSVNVGGVANTMMLATFTVLSSGAWSVPSGMSENFDRSTLGADALGISMSLDTQIYTGSTNTGSRQATLSGADADYGATHMLALRPRSGPASFVVEAVGGGSIGTQTRGEPFAVRIRALDAGGNTLTGFTGSVTLGSGCTLSGGSGTTASFVAGVLASHTVTISSTGTCTLTATQSGGSATGTSNSFQVVAPLRFNAFDTSTAAGSVSGPIRTRIAGSGFDLALVAINAAGSGVLTSFTGPVTVELLDASSDSGALNATSNCRASWTGIRTLSPNPVFAAADAGRLTAAFSEPNAWRVVRVRITHSNAAGTTVGCSTDAFAIRPASFSAPVVSDGDDASPGLNRLLDNGDVDSGTVHRAGRPFTVLAEARAASGAVTAGYAGSGATLNVGACLVPAGCSAGTLAATLTASAGALAGTASYSEGGVIAAELEDLAFAQVDAADSTLTERAIRSAAVTIGRFVADRYALALATVPVMAPGACAAGGSQSFTFVGQPFAFAAAPVLTVTPLNAAGSVLANARPRLVAAHLTATLTAAGAVPLTGTPVIATIVNGASSTVSWSAASSFAFTRSATAPVAPFAAALSFNAAVSDTSEAGASGPITGTLASTGPLAFSGGASTFHYGRLLLRSTYGERSRDLFVPLEAQSYNGSGWTGLPAAAGCIVAGTASFAYSAATGALAASGSTPNCATRVTATVTTSSGRALIRLAAPPANGSTVPAAQTLTLNVLTPASGQTCSGTTLAAAGTLAAPWLATADGAGSYGANPAARVTWGRPRGDAMLLRERFD